MTEVVLCVSCGGRLEWFASVSSWRHVWVPEGTTPHPAVLERHDEKVATAAGFVEEVVESDRETGQRILAEREEVIARARATRESLGEFPLTVERATVPPYREPEFEIRVGTTLEGEEFRYPWLVEPTWINVDGSEVRVSPGTGAKSAAKKTDRLDEHPAPTEPARPAFDSELPKAAASIKALLVEHGWEFEQLYARGFKADRYMRADHVKPIETVVLRAVRRRNREALLACWTDSRYDFAYRLTPGEPQKLASAEVPKVVKAEVLLCTTCGEPPHTHPLPDAAPACFQEESL